MDECYITLAMTSFDDFDAGQLVETVIQQKAEAQQNVKIAIANQDKAKIENETLIMMLKYKKCHKIYKVYWK